MSLRSCLSLRVESVYVKALCARETMSSSITHRLADLCRSESGRAAARCTGSMSCSRGCRSAAQTSKQWRLAAGLSCWRSILALIWRRCRSCMARLSTTCSARCLPETSVTQQCRTRCCRCSDATRVASGLLPIMRARIRLSCVRVRWLAGLRMDLDCGARAERICGLVCQKQSG